YGEPTAPSVDPYSDAYNAPAPATATSETRDRDTAPPRGRSRSRSPGARSTGYRSPTQKRRSPPPKKPTHAPIAPNPSQVLGVFGLSIRTQERDLDEEFSRFGRVEKVTIVYDQRSDRSRGFGFIRMSSTEEATRCIQELNGVELNGRRIRVDYSVTDRPHAPTPGEYMGHRRSTRDTYSGSGRDSHHRDSYRDSYRDRDYRRSDRDKDRDPYGRDSRDWRDRRSPRRYSPDYRRRGSYSRSPPRGSSPRKDYDGPSGTAAASSSNQAENGSRW
ncbi:RNA-binding domain-containing protein, partial [Suillus weaverae]